MATWQECLLLLVIVYVNDKTVEETESSLSSVQENIGMQHGAVGSPYVSQNAAETVNDS